MARGTLAPEVRLVAALKSLCCSVRDFAALSGILPYGTLQTCLSSDKKDLSQAEADHFADVVNEMSDLKMDITRLLGSHVPASGVVVNWSDPEIGSCLLKRRVARCAGQLGDGSFDSTASEATKLIAGR